jgi:hypothetical protein
MPVAGADHASGARDPAGDDQRQMDRLLAELEALLEEAKQLRARYLRLKQEPKSGR